MKELRSARKGYILMEVMLAAGIFAIAGVGLAVALNDIAKTYVQARKVNAIRIELQSRLAEARLVPLSPIKDVSKENTDGVVFKKEIALLEMTNKARTILPGLYRLTLTAEWTEGKEKQEEKAEVYVYQP